jgi:hypothetical protein
MHDLEILGKTLSNRFRVNLEFSKHAVERYRERKLSTDTSAKLLSMALGSRLCEILYLLNIDKSVCVSTPSISIVLRGTGRLIKVTTVTKSHHLKCDEFLHYMELKNA